MANTMPIAATGPRVLFDLRSLSSRHSRPAITVPPEARIGSSEPFHAAVMAEPLSALRRSSSRKRDTNSNA